MTPDSADSSIWPDQHELRWAMENLAEEALSRAGAEVDPRGFLVAYPLAGGPVVIEPSRGAYDLARLGGALEAAEAGYESHPDHALIDAGDDARADDQRAALRERCRRSAVQSALAEAARADDRVHLVGIGVTVGEYRVFPVLAVLAEPWHASPALTRSRIGLLTIDRSYQEAVVNDVLRAASRELDRQVPSSFIGVDAGAVLRSAADSLVNGVVSLTGQEFAHGMREALDSVASQPYEGRSSIGAVILARRGHPHVRVEVAFEHPVPITVPRSFRKALEMCAPRLHLLCDGREVYGLGTMARDYPAEREDCFAVLIAGSGTWELRHARRSYMRVDHGHPALPRDFIDQDEFAHTVARVFPSATADDAGHLWQIAEACAEQTHGTMLVVHPDAAAEGQRLLPQAMTMEPVRLSESALSALTKIDGAVLVSPDGLCHAVGVILDGAATGTGDSSRGARYNSAIRYLAGAGRGSMVIIVSEDGKIDLLPKLMRRVSRSYVQWAVDRLVAAAQEGEPHETFARLDRYTHSLEFYFNQEQCDAVNAARELVEQRRWTADTLRMQVVPIQPHPAMDDSYFFDQPEPLA